MGVSLGFAGAMGIVCDDTGYVEEVKGTAEIKGVREGDLLLSVDDEPYSKEALDFAEKSGVRYDVTVLKPSFVARLKGKIVRAFLRKKKKKKEDDKNANAQAKESSRRQPKDK